MHYWLSTVCFYLSVLSLADFALLLISIQQWFSQYGQPDNWPQNWLIANSTQQPHRNRGNERAPSLISETATVEHPQPLEQSHWNPTTSNEREITSTTRSSSYILVWMDYQQLKLILSSTRIQICQCCVPHVLENMYSLFYLEAATSHVFVWHIITPVLWCGLCDRKTYVYNTTMDKKTKLACSDLTHKLRVSLLPSDENYSVETKANTNLTLRNTWKGFYHPS